MTDTIRTTIDNTRTALVLMDFQPAVVGTLGDQAEVVVGKALKALQWARANRVHVAHVRVAFRDSDIEAIPRQNKGFAKMKERNLLPDGSPGCDFVDQLRPADGEIVVRKTRVGPFSTTDLRAQLRTAGIDTLLLAGIRTSGVTLSTVRQAADDDLGLYVIGDACADSDDEVHKVLIEKVFPAQAEVVTTRDLDSLV